MGSKEVWKKLKGYDYSYLISNKGRIKSPLKRVVTRNSVRIYRSRILKTQINDNGYEVVGLIQNKKYCIRKIHRLVASNFIENPFNKPQANHLNEIKTDNRSCNLAWCTRAENMNHNGLHARLTQKKSKKIIQLTLQGEFVKEWPSMMEAERNGFYKCGVRNTCIGNQYSYKGFQWKYK